MLCFMTSPHQLFSEFSAAREKLAIWLVLVIRIAADVDFFDYFCTLWDLIVISYFDVKVGRALAHCLSLPLGPTTDKGVFCEVGCLVSRW